MTRRRVAALVALCAVVGIAGCSSNDEAQDPTVFYDAMRSASVLADHSDAELDTVAETICDAVQDGIEVGGSNAEVFDEASRLVAETTGLDQAGSLVVTTAAVGLACPMDLSK